MHKKYFYVLKNLSFFIVYQVYFIYVVFTAVIINDRHKQYFLTISYIYSEFHYTKTENFFK